jgi:hypothetical protein
LVAARLGTHLKRCTLPWLLLAASSGGSTPAGLNASECTVAGRVPRRSVNALMACAKSSAMRRNLFEIG